MTRTKRHELGFLQLDPIPADARLNQFYESEYYHLIRSGGRADELRRLLEGGETARLELEWLRATVYCDCFDGIRLHSESDGPVLDVGSGTGNLVHYLQENGLPSEGIEPSAEAAQVGAGRGLRIKQATLEEIVADPAYRGRYRAVTLLNVVEHVPDPVAFLARAKSLLADGGILIVRVPNDFSEIQEVAQRVTERKRWWVADPDHINYFSPESIRATCAHVGLRVVDMFADFPMEFFLLFGINYVDQPARGEDAHAMRRRFELTLPKEKRRAIYRALTSVGVGRDLLVIARLERSTEARDAGL